MAVLSVGAAVLVPDYGVDHLYHEGDWCGVFVHKNVLGRLMVLGTLTFVLLPTNGLRGLLVRWSGALLCAAVLWMTGSKTALLMITLTLGALQFYRAVAARRWIIVGGAVSLAVLAAFLAWQDWQALLLWLGRDATLTGRIPLWGAAVTAIGHRPWVGYGFGGFWVGLKGPSLSVIDQVGWLAPHAHNGYLDLCLDLGIIGLVLFVIGLLVRLRSAMRECSIAVRDSFWPVLYLTFIVLYNIDESGLLRVNSLFCVLYAAVLASDGMQARPMIARYFQG
jgi:O-antigen ligase